VDEFVRKNDMTSLITAYYEAYPPEEEVDAEEEAPAVADASTTPAATEAVTAPAETSAAPAEIKVDVRDDAKTNPEKYMEGDKNSFIFKAEKGSDADLHVRIEDIYATDLDKTLTLTSDHFAGVEFKYDPDRGSFYESKDGGFTDQRLVIRGGDTIATKPVEAAPLVADTQAPAVDAAAAVDTPVVDAGEPAEIAPPALPEVDTAEAAKKAGGLVNSIHALRKVVEERTRALEGAGKTRASDQTAWEQVDATYVSIAKLYADPSFDLDKAPQETEDQKRLVAEVTALRDQLSTRVASLGTPDAVRDTIAGIMTVPDAKNDGGSRVVDNHDATPVVEAPAAMDAVTDGDTGDTDAPPTPSTLG
jgi:hypothetical protein